MFRLWLRLSLRRRRDHRHLAGGFELRDRLAHLVILSCQDVLLVLDFRELGLELLVFTLQLEQLIVELRNLLRLLVDLCAIAARIEIEQQRRDNRDDQSAYQQSSHRCTVPSQPRADRLACRRAEKSELTSSSSRL